ncbi:glycerophosphodiester phosphodiesterase family protein [Crateriforma spongiae]|uniref:glycerophosphodiester phosphodiesterase family protein n=1 Tax=Crateriforma spongiae TaxID=2724528 RepID=UPI0014478879|nr:glycerophosphodiester phosphodiesterase family protein [Crateriforma spongiae]
MACFVKDVSDSLISGLLYGLLAATMLGPSSSLADDPRPRDPHSAAVMHRISAETPRQLRELFRYTGHRLPVVSAHRGGAASGYPENCIATFEHTLSKCFALLEIDPRMTKDGEVIVHHDATLDRTTTGTGKVVEKTLSELKQYRLKDIDGVVTNHVIPTLDEVLHWAKGKTVLVLDQKDVPLETRVNIITKHHAESYAMMIVGSLKDVRACHAMNPDIMMEVMIPSHEKLKAFDASGVPWENVIAFLGHQPPTDPSLYEAVHQKGTLAMVGTSRNLDRQFFTRAVADDESLRRDYRQLLRRGADMIETDLPREIGPLLYTDHPAVPTSKRPLMMVQPTMPR